MFSDQAFGRNGCSKGPAVPPPPALLRRALRGQPPEPVPICFTQRRVYVLPTRAGLLFGLTLVVMLVGAINYTLSLGHALVFLLAGLGIATILATFRNLVHLRFAPGRCGPVFAGAAARFGIVLTNLRATPRFNLRLWVVEDQAVHADIPAADFTEVYVPVATTARGWLELPRVTVETRWPWAGAHRATSSRGQRCLVYPAPAIESQPLPSGAGNSQGRLHRAHGSDDFAGLRRHQVGDAPHHVAWKSAARQPDADLLTKQFADSSGETLRRPAHLPPGMDDELRLSLLACWVLDAQSAGLTWGCDCRNNNWRRTAAIAICINAWKRLPSMATTKRRSSPPLVQSQTLWLALAAFAVLLPLMPYLPLWLDAVCATAIFWRGWLLWRRVPLPPRWLVNLVAIAGTLARSPSSTPCSARSRSRPPRTFSRPQAVRNTHPA